MHAGELHAIATGLEREDREDREVARLMVVATELTTRSGTAYCDGDGRGDLWRWSTKTGSVEAVQGVRALGARLA